MPLWLSTVELEIVADQLADREADNHGQQFDAAECRHDRGRDRERPYVGRQQDVGD